MADFKSDAKKEAENKVLVCGAGSIGIFLGAKLYSNGNKVHLFGRKKLKEAGKEKVIINNKEYIIPERKFSVPRKEYYDFIFITSKLYDFEKMIKLISRNKLDGKILASIQNGLVDCSKFKEILKKKIVPICVFGGFRIEKNRIFNNPTPVGWKTEMSKQGKAVSKLISSCGILCKPDKKFESLRAEKMIANCCLNALSAIEKKQFNVLFSREKTLDRVYRIFDESYHILEREYKLKSMGKMKKDMFKNWHNVKHFSSTYQDLVSGRKSEVDFFNGYLVRLARQHNMGAEENLKILEEFRRAENGI